MDGLIFDSEKIWRKQTLEKSSRLPHKIDETVWKSWMGSQEQNVLKDLQKRFPNTDLNILINYRKAILKAVHDDFMNGKADLKNGFDEIIKFVKSKNLKTALATSSAYDIIDALFDSKGYNYRQLFDFVISGSQVKNGKPAPDIYLNCCEHFNIQPNEAIVLEDSINGVISGLNANCQTIMVIDMAQPTKELIEKCAFVCNDLIEAKDFIENTYFKY